MRNMLGDDEKNITDTLAGFKDMVKSIKQVVDQIKDFVSLRDVTLFNSEDVVSIVAFF